MAIATPTFTGFEPDAIDFLAELASNNDREWFNPRKADYERLLKARWRRSSPRSPSDSRRATSRSGQTRNARSSGSTAIPGSPRTSRRTRRTSAPASRGCSDRSGWRTRGRRGDGPRERRLLQLPARRDVRRWRDVDAREGPPRCVPARRRRRAGSGTSGPGGARLRGGLRVGQRPRTPQARPAWLPAGPPERGPASVQGRRLRAEPLRRRGAVASRSRTRSRTRTLRGCPSSVSSTRSRPERERCDSAQPSGSIEPSWPDLLAACRCRRGGRLGLALGRRPPAGRRRRLARGQARGLDDAGGARRPDRAGPARSPCRGQHVPESRA